MNVEMRVHRILSQLQSYQGCDPRNPQVSELATTELGDPLGVYENPPEAGGSFAVFARGVVLTQDGKQWRVPFADIGEVALPSEKESEGLILTLKDGRVLYLPVAGRRGRFRDSLEVLRFFYRVLADQTGRLA